MTCERRPIRSAKTVVAAQKAWAKYLGETTHEKAFPSDKAGKVTIETVLVPPGKYFRGEGKSGFPVGCRGRTRLIRRIPRSEGT